jgi:hypothetical protein
LPVKRCELPAFEVIEMTPACALPNSAELAPVVTVASSNEPVLTEISLPPRTAVPRLHAVDVGHVLIGTAAADREPAAGRIGRDARLQRQHVADPVHREVGGEVAVDALLRGDFVSRHQRLDRHDVDRLEDHGRGFHRDVLRDGLTREDPHAGHIDRPVSDEGRMDRHRARRHVVHEVVTLGVRQGAERRSCERDLRVVDGRAVLVANPALDLTSRLGLEHSCPETQRDCHERAKARHASEGADTALLHGNVLQRRETTGTASLERRSTRLPRGYGTLPTGCDCAESDCIMKE